MIGAGRITIGSDSQAALAAVSFVFFYCGLDANEILESLIKEESVLGSESVIEFLITFGNIAVENWKQVTHKNKWHRLMRLGAPNFSCQNQSSILHSLSCKAIVYAEVLWIL